MCLYALHHMHWERQARDPRFAIVLVGQIEFCRGCVLDHRLRAKIVDCLNEQMRLLPTHEIDVAHWASGIAR